MQIGPYNLVPIECGFLKLDGGAMFGVIPKNLWGKTNPADEQNRITLAMRALLVRGDGVNLLVDCGAGIKLSEKLESIYAIDYSENSLLGSLDKAGVNPAEITHVILTHLHFDHTGGATYANGEGVITPTFPNAKYFVHKDQWETASSPTPMDRASYLSENYIVLEEKGLLEIVEDPGEILPGISLIIINGHTPGQILPVIEGEEGKLLYAADFIPTASHVPIPYVMAYDLEPLETMREKERILSEAADEGWTLFYEHDPFIAAGSVEKTEKGYKAGKELKF